VLICALGDPVLCIGDAIFGDVGEVSLVGSTLTVVVTTPGLVAIALPERRKLVDA
jgi:hypothetical protein